MEIAVIGSGIMGSGIAQLCATHDHRVRLFDIREEALGKARSAIRHSLDRFEAKGQLDARETRAVQDSVHLTGELATALDGVDVVIEAVSESLELKHIVWADVFALAPATALFATNTSQLSITELAGTERAYAERFIGMHFFNPPVMMKLVEIVRGLRTSDETVRRTRKFVDSIGREPILCKKDSPGFITTRAYAALRMECLRILEEGIATAEDIDKALKLAFNFPMGPLELADFNGLDTVLSSYESLAATHGSRFLPTATLRNTVVSGRLGRKTGAGFFDYQGGHL